MSDFGYFNPMGVVCGHCDTVLTKENMSRRLSDRTMKEIETLDEYIVFVYEIMCSRCACDDEDKT